MFSNHRIWNDIYAKRALTIAVGIFIGILVAFGWHFPNPFMVLIPIVIIPMMFPNEIIKDELTNLHSLFKRIGSSILSGGDLDMQDLTHPYIVRLEKKCQTIRDHEASKSLSLKELEEVFDMLMLMRSLLITVGKINLKETHSSRRGNVIQEHVQYI